MKTCTCAHHDLSHGPSGCIADLPQSSFVDANGLIVPKCRCPWDGTEARRFSFDWDRPLERVSDVIAYLYEIERGPPFGSPPWGRNATRDVSTIILTRYHGSHDAKSLVAWMRKYEWSLNPRSSPEDQQAHYHWKRAIPLITDHLEKRLRNR